MKAKIKKYWTAWLLTVCCILLLVIPPMVAEAALTKTTSINEIDAWQAVAAGTLVVGTAEDISTSYETILYIEVALTDTDAQAGCTVIVEVSYGDDNWMELISFTGTAETPTATDVNDATSEAGDAYIILTDMETGDFDVIGRRWFVLDGTVGNSESVRTASTGASDTVTLCQDTLRNHADTTVVWDRVDQWIVNIPSAASWVRTLINNTDVDADIHYTTRNSEMTAL